MSDLFICFLHQSHIMTVDTSEEIKSNTLLAVKSSVSICILFKPEMFVRDDEQHAVMYMWMSE